MSATQLPKRLRIPTLAPLPGPTAVSAALYSSANNGFSLRGRAMFSDAATAARFVASARQGIADVKGSITASAILSGFNAYNAMTELRFLRQGHIVRFKTTLNANDANDAMERAAIGPAGIFQALGKPTLGGLLRSAKQTAITVCQGLMPARTMLGRARGS